MHFESLNLFKFQIDIKIDSALLIFVKSGHLISQISNFFKIQLSQLKKLVAKKQNGYNFILFLDVLQLYLKSADHGNLQIQNVIYLKFL